MPSRRNAIGVVLCRRLIGCRKRADEFPHGCGIFRNEALVPCPLTAISRRVLGHPRRHGLCVRPRRDEIESMVLDVRRRSADVTYAALTEMDLEDSAIVSAIFRARELALGGDDDPKMATGGIVAVTTALGWRVLTEVPGREIVLGAVTQPWMPNPVFRGLPPDEFASFAEPGYVKIIWNLRAGPRGPLKSTARTRDAGPGDRRKARTAFRRYWMLVSPGIWLIRELGLHLVKKGAEAAIGALKPDVRGGARFLPACGIFRRTI